MPGLRCLVLTSYSEQDALDAAVRAGAAGFLLKQVRGPALVSAVRIVAAGGSLFDEVARASTPRNRGTRRPGSERLGMLTDQERSVLRLIGEGLTNRQIGERMGLAEKTVKNYTSHLLAKLGLERRTQAAILATQLRDLAGLRVGQRAVGRGTTQLTSVPECPVDAVTRPPRRSARSTRFARPLRTVIGGSPQPSSVTTTETVVADGHRHGEPARPGRAGPRS